MGLSEKEIAEVIKELAPALTRGRIQKIFQPSSRAIVLDIRTLGCTLSLYMSADPETARIHFIHDRYPNPASPPAFCQFLRAHIQGARIERLEQVHGDRIVRLHCLARDGSCTLIAELTGRHANLLLIDASDKILMGLDETRGKAGEYYHPPTRPESAMTDSSPTGRVPARLHPPIQGDNSTITHEFAETSATDPDSRFPISSAIEHRYRRREEELAMHRLRQARLGELKKRIKKTVRRIEALQTDLDKASRYREYARYGELLKGNLHVMHKGQERLTVTDYFDAAMPELSIPLDPTKGPQGNMDDYFKKHRKHLVAEREVRPRLKVEEHVLQTLRTELAEFERGTWQPPPPSVARNEQRNSLSDFSTARENTVKGSQHSGPFRRFTSADGLPIYVGRNARENEALTCGEARPDDLWFHAHGAPGSHVVVRLGKGVDPPPETLRDAATLALLYSDLKKSGKGDVIYTRKKYVRKVKGASQGTVTVTQDKTLYVTLDRARLDRLKSMS